MDISIIIVAWKVKDKLRHNLEALLIATQNIRAEIFVVDNNSQDGTEEMIKAEFPTVNLLLNQENLGFSKANNQALRLAKADFILLLNPDMRVFPNTITEALKWAQSNSQATVTGFKLEDEKGIIVDHVRRFPSLSDQLAITFKLPHFFPIVTNNYLMKNFDYSKAQKVDSIRGSFFLINRQAWQKISGVFEPFLDERYFIWFEEVDFCRQVYQYGGEVWYSPAAACRDYVGQSFRQVPRGTKQLYFRNSMLSYFAKWHTPREYFILKTAWFVVSIFNRFLA
jgi:GT2 family glycosyltransferase